MNKIFLSFVFFLPLLALGQSELEAELRKEHTRLEEVLILQKKLRLDKQEEYQKAPEAIALKREAFNKNDQDEKKYQKDKVDVLSDISNKIKSLRPSQNKTMFYKCLEKALENNSLSYDQCYINTGRPRLSKEEKEVGKQWKELVGLPLRTILTTKKDLAVEIEYAKSSAELAEKKYKEALEEEQRLETEIKKTEMELEEAKVIPSHLNIVNCDKNSPEVNLEEKVPFPGAKIQGPFYGIPRDNQDGLGTCYANAAKNLLVGLSKGKDVASFLDMALQYHAVNETLPTKGLDAGNSCETLKILSKVGYCPQHFSPLETGEKNLLGEGLFNLDSQTYLATNVSLMKDFINDLETFEKSADSIDEKLLAKSKSIIETLKNNPNIQLPLPIVKYQIPEQWKLSEVHYYNKDKIGISEDDFLIEYNEAYKKFYPLYAKAVLANKSLDNIFSLYKIALNPFITKYGLQESLPEFKENFKLIAGSDFKNPKTRKKVRASLDYLKSIMDKKELSDDSFIDYCSESGNASLTFLGSLTPLVEKMRKEKLNEDKLFDKSGRFMSAKELMQLTVAPSCINSENRKMIEPFSCHDDYASVNKWKDSKKPMEEKTKIIREKIVLSLVQGYPVGNLHRPKGGGGHINTIVGIRFNKDSNKCEYRIRESQNGKSNWHPEGSILERLDALSEVRRK